MNSKVIETKTIQVNSGRASKTQSTSSQNRSNLLDFSNMNQKTTQDFINTPSRINLSEMSKAHVKPKIRQKVNKINITEKENVSSVAARRDNSGQNKVRKKLKNILGEGLDFKIKETMDSIRESRMKDSIDINQVPDSIVLNSSRTVESGSGFHNPVKKPHKKSNSILMQKNNFLNKMLK
jgi:hypothetical protein